MKKIVFIAVVIIATGIAVFMRSRLNDRHEEGGYTASGNVEVTEVDVGFKMSGRITGLLAEEGQNISKGSILATLDSAELESQVLQNSAFLSETRARLEELTAGSRPQELKQARANLRSAEAELDKAQKDYDRATALFREGIISTQQMDAAKEGYAVALSQRQNAVEALSLVKEGPRKEEIRAAENRVRQAEAALKTSDERLKDTVIYAPLSGVILRKNSEVGETVAAGIPVYTVGDLENPWIKVYVKEDKLGLIRLGQSADIKVDSFPNKVYKGTITYISSEAEFTPKNVQTPEERVKLVFGVKISVKNINNELKPGMPADVRIIQAQQGR